jgi:hypothetical protein
MPFREDRPRLDRSALRGVDEVAALDDGWRFSERRPGVALDDRGVAEQVPVAAHLVGALVRCPLLVDQRRVVGGGRLEVGNRRERLVVNLDQRCPFGSELGRQRGDGGDDVGFEAHAFLRE